MFFELDVQFINIEIIIINIIIRYVRNNLLNQKSLNSLNLFENLEASRINAIFNKNNETSRFLNNDVGFFNSFYDNKFNNIKTKMKSIRKKTYFRDVFIFINRIKNVIKVKNIKFFLKQSLNLFA